MSHFAVIIAAAGNGTRFQSGDQKKTYATLSGQAVWKHSVSRFAGRDDVCQILVVVSPEDKDWFSENHREFLDKCSAVVVAGGSERYQSVENALKQVDAKVPFVAVHDAARPCVSESMLERVFAAARSNGNAVPAVAVSSTLKRSTDGTKVDATVDRSQLYESQTPQVFRTEELIAAYAGVGDAKPTDEAQLMERMGHVIFLAEGCPLNRKITSQQDMQFAEAALAVIAQSNSNPIHFDGPISDTTTR